jgi:glutamine synthetase
VDYSIIGGSRVEPLLREIRLGMAAAGLTVESVKGECNLGQHEIAFKYADAMTTCDNHVVYKTGAKDIAAAHGQSITFMAKFNEREGNSCHIHLSFRGDDGAMVMASDKDPEHGLSRLGRSFIAGQLAHIAELTLLFAPNINSYKRFAEGSFAPTAIAWGSDNRTCAFRLVGRGASLRLENRVPGGDVNPYLAVAGMVAAGIDGISHGLELGPGFDGDAYTAGLDRVPSTLADALELWRSSAWIANTFGSEVVDHYTNMARVELDAFGRTVTDWERYRGFERL